MKIGFDLDGTLDRPAVRDLALELLASRNEIHVISGSFTEAGDWQDPTAKREKLVRLGFDLSDPKLIVTVLDALPQEKFDREYRLVDLGLRKGAYIEKNGIEIMFDDSEVYCKTMPNMCGAQIVQVLR